MVKPEGKMYMTGTGNCNVAIWDGLSTFSPYTKERSLDALWDMTTTYAEDFGFPSNAYGGFGRIVGGRAEHKTPMNGIWLFAQGSEHAITTQPYGPNLKQLIEELQLGKVIESGPAPNPYHQRKPGVLYMWVIDHTAVKRWWEEEHKRRLTIESGEKR